MNLVTFIDYRVQESREEQTGKKYSIIVDSETQALGAVLVGFRFALKWIMVPKVIIHYLIVCTGLLHAPVPMFEKKKEEERGKTLQKLGMKGKK